MTKFVGYPEDGRETPTRFFNNTVELETTLFVDPIYWETRSGRRHCTAKICFRGYKWAENGIDRIPAGRVGVKVWAKGEQALQLRDLKEGSRVLLQGYFITEDFQTDMGELKTTLSFLVKHLESIEREWDRSNDNFRKKA
jgi:primosomal replication protein N